MANTGWLIVAAVCIAQCRFVYPTHEFNREDYEKFHEERVNKYLRPANPTTVPDARLYPPSNVIQFYHTTPATPPSDHLLPPPAPLQLLKCAPRSFGKHPYLIDCSKYLKCWNGHTEILSCSPGMLFNSKTNQCELADKVDCANMFHSPNAYRIPPTRPTNYNDHLVQEPRAHKSSRLIDLSSANQRQSERQDDNVKEFGEIPCYGTNGLEPHPSDCSLFLNCVNGNGMVQQCGPGTVFNPLVQVCDWPYNVDCGQRHHVTYGENLLDVRMGGSNTRNGDRYVQPTISTARLNAITNYALRVKPIDGKGDQLGQPANRQPKISSAFENQYYHNGYGNEDIRQQTIPFRSDQHGSNQFAYNQNHAAEVEGQQTIASSFNQYPAAAVSSHNQFGYNKFGASQDDYVTEDVGQQTIPSSFDPYPAGSSGRNTFGHNEEGQHALPSRFDRYPLGTSDHNDQQEEDDQQTLSLSFGEHSEASNSYQGYNKFGSNQDRSEHQQNTLSSANQLESNGNQNKPSSGGHYIVRTDSVPSANIFDSQLSSSQRFNQHKRTTTTARPPSSTTTESEVSATTPQMSAFDQEYQEGLANRILQRNNAQSQIGITTTTRPVQGYHGQYNQHSGVEIEKVEEGKQWAFHTFTTHGQQPRHPPRQYVSAGDLRREEEARREEKHRRDEAFRREEVLGLEEEMRQEEEARRSHSDVRHANTFASNPHQTPPVHVAHEFDDDTQQQTLRFDDPLLARNEESHQRRTVPNSQSDVRHANTFASNPHQTRPVHVAHEFNDDNQQQTLRFDDPFLARNEESQQRRTVPNSITPGQAHTKPTPLATVSFVAPRSEVAADHTRTTTYMDHPRNYTHTVSDMSLEESMRILDSYSKVPERFHSGSGVHITPIYSRTRTNGFRASEHRESQTTTAKPEMPPGITSEQVNEALRMMLRPYTRGGNNAINTDVDENHDAATTETLIQTEVVQSASQTRSDKSYTRNDLDLTLDKFDRTKHGSSSTKTQHRVHIPTTTDSDIELLVPAAAKCEFDCLEDGLCVSHNKVCNGINDCGNFLDEQHCPEVNYQIRLQNNTNSSNKSHAGLLEVQAYSRWGLVCESRFGMTEAHVACKELGFPLGAVELLVGANNTAATNVTFQMDGVNCAGHEASLKLCSHMGWGSHSNCTSDRAIGVVCKVPPVMKCLPNYWLCETSAECLPVTFLCDGVRDCSDSTDEDEERCGKTVEFRLSGYPTGDTAVGRVEVRHHGVWGTVCHDEFSENEANVFCKSIGFDGPSTIEPLTNATQTDAGPVWMDEVKCVGNESSLIDCQHNDMGEHNCDHSEDVVVRCTTAASAFVWKPRNPDAVGLKSRKLPDTSIVDVPPTNYLPEQCGQIQIKDEMDFDYDLREGPIYRIHAGRPAKRGHHPWQATIRVKGINGKSAHSCGATILTRLHVVTAAHCLNFPHTAYVVRVGDHFRDDMEDTEREEFIESWRIHEQFRRGHISNNDIAVIQLKRPLDFNDYVQPICLPALNAAYVTGRKCAISGWGSTKMGKSNAAFELQSASLPLISDDICKQDKVYGKNVTDGMFCAGYLDSNSADACEGDSGGPLVCEEEDVHRLYGIISWGHRCGEKNKPGVYVKIAKYVTWIHDVINSTKV